MSSYMSTFLVPCRPTLGMDDSNLLGVFQVICQFELLCEEVPALWVWHSIWVRVIAFPRTMHIGTTHIYQVLLYLARLNWSRAWLPFSSASVISRLKLSLHSKVAGSSLMELERSSSWTVVSSSSWRASAWKSEERKESPTQYIRIHGKVCSTKEKEAEILTMTDVAGLCFLAIMSSISISRLRNYPKFCSFFIFQSSPQ